MMKMQAMSYSSFPSSSGPGATFIIYRLAGGKTTKWEKFLETSWQFNKYATKSGPQLQSAAHSTQFSFKNQS